MALSITLFHYFNVSHFQPGTEPCSAANDTWGTRGGLQVLGLICTKCLSFVRLVDCLKQCMTVYYIHNVYIFTDKRF